MKESLIGLYVENTEVPQYKSAGASGFDLRVKYNPHLAHLNYFEISKILNDSYLNILSNLYVNVYNDKEWVIDYYRFTKSVKHALNQPITYGDTTYSLIDYMKYNNIEEVNIILPYTVAKFETGVYTEIPEEDEMQIRPRSGISSSTLLDVKFGTVDNDWRGNSGIIVQNPTPYSYVIIPGTRLAQGVIAEKKRAVFDIKDSKDELSKTERGENGFGKSGLM